MPTRFVSVVIDATDHRSLGRWWAETLSWPIQFDNDDEVVVEPDENEETELVPALVFVPVPEVKTTKNRIHLDLASQSLADQSTTVARLVARGASPVDIGQDKNQDHDWVVLADPEGNEFCVLAPTARYLAGGPLAAIVVASADPHRAAAFWAAATSWTIGYDDGRVVSLHAPHGAPPDVDFVPSDEAKTTKNRVHLDVAPRADEDQAAAVAVLEALGARRVDVGQADCTWVVLADPEGNEFCVLSPRH